MAALLSRLLTHPGLVWGLGAFSLVALVASVLLVPWFLARLPAEYLRDGDTQHHHSMAFRVLRNALGVLLVMLGLVMLVLPGQGLLTLLVGLLLVDFRGKHALLVRFLSRPQVLSVVNKLRAKHGSPPLLA